MSRTGKSPTSSVSGLTKMPYLSCASKYLTPLTVPLPFPKGSSSLTPTKYPAPRSSDFPTNPTSPLVPLLSLHLDPIEMVEASSERYSSSVSI